MKDSPHRADFGIIVALPVELDAVLHQLGGYQQVTRPHLDNRTYYQSELRIRNGQTYQIVVTMLPRMGNIESALATSDLIRTWQPQYVLMVGIAGGISPDRHNLGDVVVGERILYYEEAKLRTTGKEVRSRQIEPSELLFDRARNLASKDWPACIPVPPPGELDRSPLVHFGPIASGEKVIADSKVIKDLVALLPKLSAVEMESAGVAEATLSAVTQTGFLSIRGLSDFSDEAKQDDWQPFAAHAAAAWTRAFLVSEPVAPLSNRLSDSPAEERSGLDRVTLFEAIRKRISLDEFKTFCFVLGVDIDNLPENTGKDGKVRELILYFDRRQLLGKLASIWTSFESEL